MTRDELRTAIVSCLEEIAPDAAPAQVAGDRDLRDALELDSMDFLRFVQAIQRRIGVEVPERDYRAIGTLDGCTDYLARATAH